MSFEPESTSSFPLYPERVLVVEDDPAVSKVMAEVLAQQGMRVTTTGNCRQALHLANQSESKLLIIEACLAGPHCIDEYRRLKIVVPAVTLFTFANPFDLSGLSPIFTSTDALLEKPFNAKQLLYTIRGMFLHRRFASTQKEIVAS